MNKALTDVLDRVQSWPEDAQAELEHVALEIEAELRQRTYPATSEELAGIQRGLEAAERGQFATHEEVEAVLAKYPRT
jgi:predicted transcriptional regulator